jgi:hypothetical protein
MLRNFLKVYGAQLSFLFLQEQIKDIIIIIILYTWCHFTDDTDPSFLVLEPDSQADLLVRLCFSTYTLNENKIRPLMDQELQITVSAFLDLRPDGYAIHQKSKRLAILEFTRAMDSSEDWEEKKDAEKRSRYAPVLEFFNALRERQGWTMIQFNFMVWVRG